mmetsp:Transcript_5819/g.13747  ORF Transcript_5819/g.13747 Transcript_5819/m.13747 type:complete len:101 (+) Transcript_5819:1121-1423(+)
MRDTLAIPVPPYKHAVAPTPYKLLPLCVYLSLFFYWRQCMLSPRLHFIPHTSHPSCSFNNRHTIKGEVLKNKYPGVKALEKSEQDLPLQLNVAQPTANGK